MRRSTVALGLIASLFVSGCDDEEQPPPLAGGAAAGPTGSMPAGVGPARDGPPPVGPFDGSVADIPVLDTPTNGTCAVACDCPQTMDCVDGLCTVGEAPVYCCSRIGCPLGNRCVSATGGVSFCGAPDQTCVNLCSCPQGMACVGSVCRLGAARVFCCDKPGCPDGQPCLTSGGVRSTCGGF